MPAVYAQVGIPYRKAIQLTSEELVKLVNGIGNLVA